MTLDAIQRDHLKTQRKIETSARERHFQGKGRWEEEKSLVDTIRDIEDRLYKIENILETLENEHDSDGSADDSRSDAISPSGTHETIST